MPGVKIDDTVGLKISGDGGFTVDSGVTFTSTTAPTFTATPISTLQAKTADTTITAPGVYTVSSSNATALGMTMPLASSVPGGFFTFRSTSAHQHFLTASAGDVGRIFTDGTSVGWKLAIAGTIGSSVSVVSDGKNYCVLAKSGTLSFTAP